MLLFSKEWTYGSCCCTIFFLRGWRWDSASAGPGRVRSLPCTQLPLLEKGLTLLMSSSSSAANIISLDFWMTGVKKTENWGHTKYAPFLGFPWENVSHAHDRALCWFISSRSFVLFVIFHIQSGHSSSSSSSGVFCCSLPNQDCRWKTPSEQQGWPEFPDWKIVTVNCKVANYSNLFLLLLFSFPDVL